MKTFVFTNKFSAKHLVVFFYLNVKRLQIGKLFNQALWMKLQVCSMVNDMIIYKQSIYILCKLYNFATQ